MNMIKNVPMDSNLLRSRCSYTAATTELTESGP